MGGVDFVHMFVWNYDNTNVIPTQTWRAVGNPTNESYFEEKVQVGEFGTDYDAGTIQSAIEAEYFIHGWTQWNESGAAGEIRITGINFGSSDRQIAIYNFDATIGSIAEYKLPVSQHYIGAISSVWLEVWHNSGSTRSLRDAEFSVYRIRPYTDADHELRP